MSFLSWLKGLFKAEDAVTSTASIVKIWEVDGVKNIQRVVKSVGPAAEAAGKTVMTWANACKVAVVGGFGFLFLHGGASEVVATTLGISEDAAQILIWIVALFFLLVLAWWLAKFIRSRASSAAKRVQIREERPRYAARRYAPSEPRQRYQSRSGRSSGYRRSSSGASSKKGVRR